MTTRTRLVNVRLAIAGGLLVLMSGAVACRPQVKPPEAEAPTLNLTDWTDKTGLHRNTRRSPRERQRSSRSI